ncbi:cupin [candidate division GN15 bacterium]|uniref:Cupin n=1 Tax=candidate division GN15 bacterium TaxID=2072418 RepID=A0A855X5B9_9BACT|nr:MAG: cupin [candidate division GN15 bacterium]
MSHQTTRIVEPVRSLMVPAGQDSFEEQRSLGISTVTFKRTPSYLSDAMIIENTFHAKGGPPRHRHLHQDEWFYIVDGEFSFEIGTERYTLTRGDSLFAPRRVSHVWAHTGEGRGKVLIAFFPAGQMEAFFRIVTDRNAMPPEDPKLWYDHGMELLGPPLRVR